MLRGGNSVKIVYINLHLDPANKFFFGVYKNHPVHLYVCPYVSYEQLLISRKTDIEHYLMIWIKEYYPCPTWYRGDNRMYFKNEICVDSLLQGVSLTDFVYDGWNVNSQDNILYKVIST